MTDDDDDDDHGDGDDGHLRTLEKCRKHEP